MENLSTLSLHEDFVFSDLELPRLESSATNLETAFLGLRLHHFFPGSRNFFSTPFCKVSESADKLVEFNMSRVGFLSDTYNLFFRILPKNWRMGGRGVARRVAQVQVNTKYIRGYEAVVNKNT